MNIPGESPHFVRAVTEMGDTREVIASEDIYASNGTKLLAKGARIDSKQFEKLTRYKLSAPLDQVLSSDKAVDAATLAIELDRILEQEAVYRQLLARAGDPRQLKHCTANLRLHATIELRLTVMSDKHPEVFGHTLRTAIIAFACAQRMGVPAGELPAVLLAALCHDFGEMHTDPRILDQSHQVTAEERRFVHVHPVTGYVLLKDLKDFPLAAARAVLQHHERLDGSGYPYGLRGAQVDRMARIVAAADVAETVMRRLDMQRLEMLYRINKQRFDSEVAATLRDLLQLQSTQPDDSAPALDPAVRLTHLSELLHAWFALKALLEQRPQADAPASPMAFLFDRMASIRSLVLQAGFNPDNITSMLAMVQDDAAVLAELRAMLDEMDWLLADLANEIDRRSPALDGLSAGAMKGLMQQLRAEVH
ncbi:HD-GYP domain-containing protein [Pseudoduganella violaceinigra]|uniref:HD-GYP domain-containing protein n=1 Tax=Pseudoduganella violaceinigra TaxID=246602 RepID=UPI001376B44A|nr:HD domain-containing phosphohydrolase [Pseudoduganella violaceinigra]